MAKFEIDYGQLLKNIIANKCMEKVDEHTMQKEMGEFSSLITNNKPALDAVNENISRLSPADVLLITRLHTPYIHLCIQLCEKYGFLGDE